MNRIILAISLLLGLGVILNIWVFLKTQKYLLGGVLKRKSPNNIIVYNLVFILACAPFTIPIGIIASRDIPDLVQLGFVTFVVAALAFLYQEQLGKAAGK